MLQKIPFVLKVLQLNFLFAIMLIENKLQGVAQMVFFITLKDIAAFFRSEKKVFIWLLICMISGSFVLNYSYSFARWRGAMRGYVLEGDQAKYKIYGNSPTAVADEILNQIDEGDFPGIAHYQLFGKSENGFDVAGSSFISERTGVFTGAWYEGRYADIENTGEPVCAVDIKYLDYGGRFQMTGEKFVLDGEEFTIRGVYELFSNNNGAVIFADKFIEKYDSFNSMWIMFEERLDEAQEREFISIINSNIQNAQISYPADPRELGAETVKSNEIQYSAIIILLLVCLVSLIKYWQAVNLPAYTVYWINGATNGTVMRVALCESLLLCVPTYFLGLGLNAISRNFFAATAPLTLTDIGIGFGIFFGTFVLFTLINTAKICKQFKVTNVRRE